MINKIKKLNKNVLALLAAMCMTLSQLYMLLGISAGLGYAFGYSFASIAVAGAIVLTITLFFVYKLVCYVGFRITCGIFFRRTKARYPFPIPYDDFSKTYLAFVIPTSLIQAIIMIPAFFIGALGSVLSAVCQLFNWTMLALMTRHYTLNYSDPYNRGDVAFATGILAFILCLINVVMLLLEVISL